MNQFQKHQRRCANLQACVCLALARYNFSTPDICLVVRHVFGHTISGRTIKRLSKSAGNKMKRGRPRSTPRVQQRDLTYLIECSFSDAESSHENTLHFLQNICAQFGLTPRQYLEWVKKMICRGKSMMRRCLLCEKGFPSASAGERHCRSCMAGRNRLLKQVDGALDC